MCRLLYDQSSLRNRWEILGGPQQSAFLSCASAGWQGLARPLPFNLCIQLRSAPQVYPLGPREAVQQVLERCCSHNGGSDTG